MSTGLPMEDGGEVDIFDTFGRIEQLEADVQKWKTAANAATMYVPEPERTSLRRQLGLAPVEQFGKGIL